MDEKRSLTPAQIQYLRIGPKVLNSTTAKQQLQQTLDQYHLLGAQPGAALANLPKFTYGHFENTVNNFGVLLNRNFIGTSTLHQRQKYGSMASQMDKLLQNNKDKATQSKKSTHRTQVTDGRTSLKAIHEFNGHKLLLTLKSFSIQTIQSGKTLQTLQLPFLRLMVSKVSSNQLIKAVEAAMRHQGGVIVVDYTKMQSKFNHSSNNEIKYHQGPHTWQKSGQLLRLVLPYLQIFHAESQYRNQIHLDNSDILNILDSDFDNFQEIIDKYVDLMELEPHLQRYSEQQAQQQDD